MYRKIDLSFWTDAKVDDDFTPEDKYFYLYLLTNPHTNICGCYEISMKQFARETGYNEDTILRLIRRMEDVHQVIRYDSATKEVLILRWGRYNWTKSDKLISGVKSVAQNIKSEVFRDYIMKVCNAESDTLCIPYPYPMDTSVTVTVTDISNKTTEKVDREKKREKGSGGKGKTEQPVKAGVFETFAGEDKELLDALLGYEKMRVLIKKPMTDRSRTMLCNKMKEYPTRHWIPGLDKAINRNWLTFYGLDRDEAQRLWRSYLDSTAGQISQSEEDLIRQFGCKCVTGYDSLEERNLAEQSTGGDYDY